MYSGAPAPAPAMGGMAGMGMGMAAPMGSMGAMGRPPGMALLLRPQWRA
jgi:hypothetical protein